METFSQATVIQAAIDIENMDSTQKVRLVDDIFIQEKCLGRLTARLQATSELPTDLAEEATTKFVDEHPERHLLAFVYGHLLLEGRLADGLDEEKACDRFAGAFLAPRVAVYQLLGQRRHALEWQELYALKHEFGLSMAGCLQRAKQCGVITESAHLSMLKRFSAKGWRKNEPGDPLPIEHPRLFDQLVYRALAEQYISEGKAAELLGIPMMRFHKERQLESSDAVTHQ